MKVALLLITDGRDNYLTDTLTSIGRFCGDMDWAQKIMVDDSGRDTPPPVDLDGWTLVQNRPRQGLGPAVRAGWAALDDDIDYVWHHEDDFLLVDTPPIAEMVEALETHSVNPRLAQVALLRQPWSDLEKLNGSIYACRPGEYRPFHNLVIQRHLFTFNPSIYPRWVTEQVGVGVGLEQDVTDQLTQDGATFFAYWGGLDDAPRCWHIGVSRSDGYRWGIDDEMERSR